MTPFALRKMVSFIVMLDKIIIISLLIIHQSLKKKDSNV